MAMGDRATGEALHLQQPYDSPDKDESSTTNVFQQLPIDRIALQTRLGIISGADHPLLAAWLNTLGESYEEYAMQRRIVERLEAMGDTFMSDAWCRSAIDTVLLLLENFLDAERKVEDIIDKLFSPAFPPFLSFEVVDQQNYSPDRQPVRLPPQIHSWLTKLAVPLLTLVGFPATDAPSAPGDTGATLDGRRWRPLIFEQPLFEGLRALLGGQVGIEPAADVIQALRDWGGTVAARVRLLRRGSAAELTDVINAFWKVGPPLPCYLATSGAADSTSPTGPVPVSTTLRLSMYQALLAVRLETLDTVANARLFQMPPLGGRYIADCKQPESRGTMVPYLSSQTVACTYGHTERIGWGRLGMVYQARYTTSEGAVPQKVVVKVFDRVDSDTNVDYSHSDSVVELQRHRDLAGFTHRTTRKCDDLRS